MTSGIYKITNTINNKVYIGQSINIEERWKQHKKDYLKTDVAIYRAFKKYGIDNFKFEVLCSCPSEVLTEREDEFIRKYNSIEDGYNMIKASDSIGVYNRILTDEEVIDIRTRKFNGESLSSVFNDYDNKMKKGGFESVWNGSRYQHIMMDNYTEENISKLKEAQKVGENNPKAKLTEKDVINIRTRKNNGEAFRFVFQDYKEIISYGGMRQVWSGKSWKYITI